jgi:hypothetical protein
VLDTLLAKVAELRGGLSGKKVVRLEPVLFISSAASTTPLHFDPEINHYILIKEEKNYHVYFPNPLKENELEHFYINGIVEIGQIDLGSGDQSLEHVGDLLPAAASASRKTPRIGSGPERSAACHMHSCMRPTPRVRLVVHWPPTIIWENLVCLPSIPA